jgi:proteasome lid subunit RPN8/RPN11
VALHLCSEHRQSILAHAERAYPEECCGLLLGKLNRTDAGAQILIEVWQTENRWQAGQANEEGLAPGFADKNSPNEEDLTKSRRYWIDPRDMLKAQRYGRDRQLDIIGIYHSHPDHAALPSECDRVFAWPQYAYVIVSVHQGAAQDLRCWSLDADRQFQSEEIVMVESDPI